MEPAIRIAKYIVAMTAIRLLNSLSKRLAASIQNKAAKGITKLIALSTKYPDRLDALFGAAQSALCFWLGWVVSHREPLSGTGVFLSACFVSAGLWWIEYSITMFNRA